MRHEVGLCCFMPVRLCILRARRWRFAVVRLWCAWRCGGTATTSRQTRNDPHGRGGRNASGAVLAVVERPTLASTRALSSTQHDDGVVDARQAARAAREVARARFSSDLRDRSIVGASSRFRLLLRLPSLLCRLVRRRRACKVCAGVYPALAQLQALTEIEEAWARGPPLGAVDSYSQSLRGEMRTTR